MHPRRGMTAGPEEEIALLMRRWEQVKAGDGAVVLIGGEPGNREIAPPAFGHLGEVDGARRIWGELKEINPKYSFNEHIARQPLRPEDAERVASGLAKAGLLS